GHPRCVRPRRAEHRHSRVPPRRPPPRLTRGSPGSSEVRELAARCRSWCAGTFGCRRGAVPCRVRCRAFHASGTTPIRRAPKSSYVSDTSTTATEAQPQDDAVATMGDTEYVPRQIVDDDLGGLSLDEAYEQSMVTVEDGQIVSGTVVKVDRDEVLLD